MAASRALVVFAGALGASEWIVEGRTGFVVENAEEARARIGSLARDGALRAAIGSAAREVVITLLQRQRERACRFYLEPDAYA